MGRAFRLQNQRSVIYVFGLTSVRIKRPTSIIQEIKQKQLHVLFCCLFDTARNIFREAKQKRYVYYMVFTIHH